MRVAPLIPVLVLAACGGDASFPVPKNCNPLTTGHCMVPWPSSAFEVDDASTPTGKRLAIPDGALPTNIDKISTDPTAWNTADGFSPSAPMVIAWPGGVSAAGLPTHHDMAPSLAADSPTVLLDMTTGMRVAHWAEIDAQADSTPDSQALFIRPAQRLVGGHRYAVAITTRVKAKDGSDLVVPPGFAAMRDGKPPKHPLAARIHMSEVLDALGIPKEDLVIAWDFTTASDDFIHRDMIAARDRALAALASHPIQYTITSDAPVDATIQRKITGTLDAPLFLTQDGKANPGTTVARDADGLPAVQGFYQIPFTAIVPACAYTAAQPVGMVIYGHGLLGTSGETSGGVQSTTAGELCVVFVGTDMRGMSTMDLPAVVRALNELTLSSEVMDVLVQGMINHITLVAAMRTTFAQTLFVDGAKVLVDPSKVYYYGLSQGGIMGTTVMAYEPNIRRAVLGVGAANYSLLLERSTDWPQYRTILNGAYPDSLDVTLGINLMQMRWDRVEGAGVANSVLAGTPTGVPPKQLLMQIAVGDEQVPNLGSYWQARTMGIPLLSPTVQMPWGLTAMASPLASGSALVIMDGGAPPIPDTNVPAPNTGMHSMPRKQPATRRQIKAFFETGQIVNECSGACLCASGACN